MSSKEQKSRARNFNISLLEKYKQKSKETTRRESAGSTGASDTRQNKKILTLRLIRMERHWL